MAHEKYFHGWRKGVDSLMRTGALRSGGSRGGKHGPVLSWKARNSATLTDDSQVDMLGVRSNPLPFPLQRARTYKFGGPKNTEMDEAHGPQNLLSP